MLGYHGRYSSIFMLTFYQKRLKSLKKGAILRTIIEENENSKCR